MDNDSSVQNRSPLKEIHNKPVNLNNTPAKTLLDMDHSVIIPQETLIPIEPEVLESIEENRENQQPHLQDNDNELQVFDSNNSINNITATINDFPENVIPKVKLNSSNLSDSFINNFSTKLTLTSAELDKTLVEENNEQNNCTLIISTQIDDINDTNDEDENTLVNFVDYIQKSVEEPVVCDNIEDLNSNIVEKIEENVETAQQNSDLQCTEFISDNKDNTEKLIDCDITQESNSNFLTLINDEQSTEENCDNNSIQQLEENSDLSVNEVINESKLDIDEFVDCETVEESDSNCLQQLNLNPDLCATLLQEPSQQMSEIMDNSFDVKCNDATMNGASDCKSSSIDNKQVLPDTKKPQVCIQCEKLKSESHLLKEENEVLKIKHKASEDEVQQLRSADLTSRKEVKDLKMQIHSLEMRFKEIETNESKLTTDLNNKTQTEIQVKRVMDEYEKSISSFVAEIEKLKKERDTAQMHLANVELAFSDVHQKYERCKAIVDCYKDNEESLKQGIARNEEIILKHEQKYESLKSHAMAQLEKSTQDITMLKKQHDQEIARVTAQLKRYEITNNSLMETLQQKAKECEQLSAVCDEFIGKS